MVFFSEAGSARSYDQIVFLSRGVKRLVNGFPVIRKNTAIGYGKSRRMDCNAALVVRKTKIPDPPIGCIFNSSKHLSKRRICPRVTSW